MISEVQYGGKINILIKKQKWSLIYLGRVTDDFDKRLLKTYVKCWFRDEMFVPNFQFEEKTYRIPKMTRIDDVFDYIETIPNYDSGKVFGLSPLANDRFVWIDWVFVIWSYRIDNMLRINRFVYGMNWIQ